jgi:hypothetical protein
MAGRFRVGRSPDIACDERGKTMRASKDRDGHGELLLMAGAAAGLARFYVAEFSPCGSAGSPTKAAIRLRLAFKQSAPGIICQPLKFAPSALVRKNPPQAGLVQKANRKTEGAV